MGLLGKEELPLHLGHPGESRGGGRSDERGNQSGEPPSPEQHERTGRRGKIEETAAPRREAVPAGETSTFTLLLRGLKPFAYCLSAAMGKIPL